MRIAAHGSWHTDCGDLLGDTHGVLALTDECLLIVLSLWPHRDELERVRSGAELAVDRFHLGTGAVRQVDATDGILTGEEEKLVPSRHCYYNYRQCDKVHPAVSYET